MQGSRRSVLLSLQHLVLVSLLWVSPTLAASRCSAPYPDRCDCDAPSANKTGTIVYCRHLRLDYIPAQFPADTVRINFGYNSIRALTADSFRNLPILNTLILDNCEIQTIAEDTFRHLTSLRKLVLTNNQIESLHPGTFQGLVSLEELHLNGNHIADVPDFLFNGLSLTDVNLQGNRLESIAEKAFHGAAIRNLQMDNNNFPSISEQALEPLQSSLSTLALSHNRQPLDLESTVFSNFTFEELTLCDNGLMNTSFLKGTKAKNLDIGANPLYSVDFQDYSNLQYTHKFYLRNVSIDNLNDVTLSNLREVGLLDLSRNKLSVVQADVFRNTPQLETLILSENQLTQVPRNLGVYLSELNELDLHSNMISRLRPADFTDLINLQTLKLELNQIQVIPQAMQPVFDRISTVRLDDNPLHCNCEMRWFREWLDVYRTSMGVAFCFTPNFEYIFNLEYEDFACTEPTIRSINSNLTVELGNTFLLTCTAQSDPAPQVEWSAPFGDVISITPSRNRAKLKTSAIWKIDHVRAEQAGVYTCSATNIAGRVEAHVCVRIEDGGAIISEPCVFPTEPPETATTPEPPTTLVVEETTVAAVVTTAEDLVTTVTTAAEDTTSASGAAETTAAAVAATATPTSVVLTDSTARPARTSPKSTRHRPSGSTPNTQANSSDGASNNTVLTYALIIGGSVVGLAVLAVVVYGLCHSSKKRKQNRDYELARGKVTNVNSESQA